MHHLILNVLVCSARKDGDTPCFKRVIHLVVDCCDVWEHACCGVQHRAAQLLVPACVGGTAAK